MSSQVIVGLRSWYMEPLIIAHGPKDSMWSMRYVVSWSAISTVGPSS